MGKIVLVVLFVVVLLWLLRSGRRRDAAPPTAKPASPDEPKPMIRCAQCGIHLPQGEALPGRGGAFCGEAHRTEFEKVHPLP